VAESRDLFGEHVFPRVSQQSKSKISGRPVGETVPGRRHCGGKTVNDHQLDVDIQHLECVIRLISRNDRLPLSYWRNRLNAVSAVAVTPSQVSRVKRLNDALRELENQCEVTPRRKRVNAEKEK
jgi:hypothetical protein